MKEKQIDGYQITPKLVGKGSFSSVYIGYDQNHERLAVKVIPRHTIKQKQVNLFINQISTLKKCSNQPFIVKLVDFKKTNSNYYLFLEYCEGGTLSSRLQNSPSHRLPEKQTMDIFCQLVKGMKYMRKYNIVHRDIKPTNIMFKNNQVKYVDFGLACKFNEDYQKGQLMKTFVGTPFNMAPQILKGQPYDDRVDLYSLGTVLYEMLFGLLPYQGNNYSTLLQNINKKNINLPKDKINMSRKLKQVLKGMLVPQPQKRIQFTQVYKFVLEYEKQTLNKNLESIAQYYQQFSYQYFRNKNYLFGCVASPIWVIQHQMQIYKLSQKLIQMDRNFVMESKSENKIYKKIWDMDLRLCCQLVNKLTNFQIHSEIKV